MDTYRNELVRQLVRDALRKGAATPKRGNKKAAGSNDSAVPQLTANQGGHWPVRLVWSQPTTMRKRASNKAPLLMVVR